MRPSLLSYIECAYIDCFYPQLTFHTISHLHLGLQAENLAPPAQNFIP